MKNILLLVHDDDGQEARLQASLDVVRAVEGHLSCLDVVVLPATLGSDNFYYSATAMLLQEETKWEQANRTRIEERLKVEDVPWDWTDVTGQIATSLDDAASLADLIVVNRQLDQFPVPDMRSVAGDVVIRSRRPVLAVPASLERLDLSSALIAWDGSPSSATALRAAVPLLALAEHVVVLEVEDDSIEQPAEEAAQYLARHGIEARIERKAPLPAGVARTVMDAAGRHHSGYVVLGGYSHRRLAEAVFGGVTRELLKFCPVPLFMAH